MYLLRNNYNKAVSPCGFFLKEPKLKTKMAARLYQQAEGSGAVWRRFINVYAMERNR